MLKNCIFLLLFVIFVARGSEVEKVQRRDCPRGWQRYDRTKSCFLIHDVRLRWGDAEKNCQRHGGHLASIADEYENIYIFDFVKRANLSVPTVWLGKIIKLAKNGAYEWNDSTMGRYGAGFRGEPPSGNNICLTMWADNEKVEGSWLEWQCDYPNGYASICKKSFRRGTSPQQVVSAPHGHQGNESSRGGSEKPLAEKPVASAASAGSVPTPPQHASKRCCISCPNAASQCGANERCIPDDLNCLIKSCNNTAPGWCLPAPTNTRL